MKNVLMVFFTLVTAVVISQNTNSLNAFDALDSNIGATINIIKSSDHKISISGGSNTLKHLSWSVDDKKLVIRSKKDKIRFDAVVLNVFTSSLNELNISHGGKATMDASFSRLDNFIVSASDAAIVDLSKIEFTTLVANSNSGAQIIYKKTNIPDSSTKGGRKAKSIQ